MPEIRQAARQDVFAYVYVFNASVHGLLFREGIRFYDPAVISFVLNYSSTRERLSVLGHLLEGCLKVLHRTPVRSTFRTHIYVMLSLFI